MQLCLQQQEKQCYTEVIFPRPVQDESSPSSQPTEWTGLV